MSLYVPNEGELEIMRAVLLAQAWYLGLYKNVVSADGSTSMLNIEEMPSGGGRSYATKALAQDFATSETENKWYLSLNASGKAEGIYSDDYLDFEFNATDVLDENTVYGVFAYCYVIPFDAGQSEGPFVPGNTVTGFTSGATGVVTGVVVTSGSWAADNAAGYLFIKSKSATAFQNNEALKVSGTTIATSNTGTLYDGDAHKKLVWLEELSESKLIDTSGQKIRVRPKWTVSTQ